jgi:hypothetical protein
MHTHWEPPASHTERRWFAAEMEVLERARMADRVRAAVYLYDDPENIIAELMQRKWCGIHTIGGYKTALVCALRA